ncbi:hypothetical protein V6C32_11405 [Desulforamulus ruminis]|uniref:hypothetical protein n=1 Tax=Desulforamulus ruminis TaxID=1564 RepID=UPI002FD94A4A
MNIYHFYPKTTPNGIRFLQSLASILKYEFGSKYRELSRLGDFYSILDQRKYSTDVILITAHGANNCIYGDGASGTENQITIDNSQNFCNSFVFAFSCSTAHLGKRMVEQHDVITYVGFNKDIPLVIKQKREAQFKEELNKLLKEIYVEAIVTSFDEFLKNGHTADEFVRLLQKRLTQLYVKLMNLGPQDLAKTYSISHRTTSNEEFYLRLSTHFLATINSVSEMIELHGEKEFVPLVCLNVWDKDKAGEILKGLTQRNIGFEDKLHFYVHYVMSELYRVLWDYKNMNKHLQFIEETKPDYYSQLNNQQVKIV